MSSVTAADVLYMRSAITSNDGTNGGRVGDIQLQNLSHNVLLGFVSQDTRKLGATFYRKIFWEQINADDSYAYEVILAPLLPSNAGDRLYYRRGTMTDTQAEIVAATNQYARVGAGKLYADITAGATSLTVTMKSNNYEFEPASQIYIYAGYQIAQTFELGSDGNPTARVGDSVAWSTVNSRWEKLATKISDYAYPNGVYIGNLTVLSNKSDTKYDFVKLKENKWTETIGTGNGSSTTRTLTALTHITNGLALCKGYEPTITATCSGLARTVTVKPDGSCTGYCSAGQLNIATGAWTTQITWLTTPDNATNISAAYYDKCYTYSGNNVTLALDSAAVVSNSYLAASTYVSGTILAPNPIKAYASTVTVSSTGGTYNNTLYQVYCYNDGTLKHDTITLTFTSSTTFTAAGSIIGSLGTGNITTNFEPINARYGQPWFSFLKTGLGGTFVTGDTLSFVIYPAVFPFWLEEVIPADTGPTPNNLIFWCAFNA